MPAKLPDGPQALDPIDDTPTGDYRIEDMSQFASAGGDPPPAAPADTPVAPQTYTAEDIARIRAEMARDQEIAILKAKNEVLERTPQYAPAPAAPVAPVAPVLDPYAQAIQEATTKGLVDDGNWIFQRTMAIQNERHQAELQQMAAAIRAEVAPAVNTIKANRVIDAINPNASVEARAELAGLAHYFDPATMNAEQRRMMELALLGAEAKAAQATPQRGAPVNNFRAVNVNPTDFQDTNNFIANLSKEFGINLSTMSKEEYANLARK